MKWPTTALMAFLVLTTGAAVLMFRTVPPARSASAWTVHFRPNPIDPKNSESYATVEAAERVQRNGKSLTAWLMARCVEQRSDGVWIAVSFNFAAPVSSDDVKARWRVDDQPIQEAVISRKANGRAFEIYVANGPSPVVDQLMANAKTLKAEMILPRTGVQPLTYSVVGAKQAFARVRCKN